MTSTNERDISARLEELPPAMSHPADRFEQIRERVKRRRRAQVAGAVAASAIALAVVVPALWQLLPGEDAASPAGRRIVQPDDVTSTVVSRQDRASTQGPVPRPGGTETTTYGTPRTATYTGTAMIDLGERPDEATGVDIELTCLSSGELTYPDGASQQCSAADVGEENPGWVVDLGPGVQEVTITATEGASWKVTTTYVSTRTIEWGINAKGETFGVENEFGTPDLIGVVATNGRTGYAYSEDLENAGGPPPTSPEEAGARQSANAGKTFTVPVYESDGETRIGEFTIG